MAKPKVGATDTDGDNNAILATDSGRRHPGARRTRVFFPSLLSMVAECTAKRVGDMRRICRFGGWPHGSHSGAKRSGRSACTLDTAQKTVTTGAIVHAGSLGCISIAQD